MASSLTMAAADDGARDQVAGQRLRQCQRSGDAKQDAGKQARARQHDAGEFGMAGSGAGG